MALSRSKSIFGIHSVCPYNFETYEPYGIFKVVGNMSLSNSQEQVPLMGGSSAFPFDIEQGAKTAEGSFLVREVPDFAFEPIEGAAATTNAAETGGAVTTIANIKGTSLVTSTGVASIGVKSGSETEVKTGLYVVKVVSSTTVDVYSLTDVDAKRGTDLAYQNDALKITASALTIATSTAVEIPDTGLELTGGAGIIGMTVGDTAWFDARSINTGSTTVTVGGSTDVKPTIGLLCACQKKGNGEIFMLDIMKVVTGGFPFNMTEKAWMESEITFQAAYNSTRDGVYRYIRVDGS